MEISTEFACFHSEDSELLDFYILEPFQKEIWSWARLVAGDLVLGLFCEKEIWFWVFPKMEIWPEAPLPTQKESWAPLPQRTSGFGFPSRKIYVGPPSQKEIWSLAPLLKKEIWSWAPASAAVGIIMPVKISTASDL